MKKVNYRTSIIIGRLLVCALFTLSGVALILASMYLEVPTVRKAFSVAVGILGILFFGKMAIMLIILLFKSKKMFSYDQENITVRGRTIKINSIKNVEQENEVQTGYLVIKTPALVLNIKGGEPIYIPTYY